MAQTHRYKRVLPSGCPSSRILRDFDSVRVHRKGVKSGSQMTHSKNDTGPFGVSLAVFSARSEAPLSRFVLRRVVCFTYPQCTFQTMHALQKEVTGVKWRCTKRRKTPPSARSEYQVSIRVRYTELLEEAVQEKIAGVPVRA